MAEKWRLEGSVLDACNCLTLCPCNYAQPSTEADCRVSFAWHIERGHYGGTNLDGLHAAAVMFARGDPFLVGIDKIAMILDERATPPQREALLTILSGQAGGLWGIVASMVKSPPEVLFAKFVYANDGKTWSVKAGSALDVQASFVKAAPGMPFESAPKRAQTYDPFYGPTMEKVVGISENYRAKTGSMDFDITGRYSSSGRFVYAS